MHNGAKFGNLSCLLRCMGARSAGRGQRADSTSSGWALGGASSRTTEGDVHWDVPRTGPANWVFASERRSGRNTLPAKALHTPRVHPSMAGAVMVESCAWRMHWSAGRSSRRLIHGCANHPLGARAEAGRYDHLQSRRPRGHSPFRPRARRGTKLSRRTAECSAACTRALTPGGRVS
jgi:hypothetical protein